jgi:hypothetical protein
MNNCPNCGGNLIGDLIFDTFLKENEGNRQQALRDAYMYGATETEGYWKLERGIYDFNRDMTVAYQCPHCQVKWDRFTGKVYE